MKNIHLTEKKEENQAFPKDCICVSTALLKGGTRLCLLDR